MVAPANPKYLGRVFVFISGVTLVLCMIFFSSFGIILPSGIFSYSVDKVVKFKSRFPENGSRLLEDLGPENFLGYKGRLNFGSGITDEELWSLPLEKKLAFVNTYGPDAYNFDLSDYQSDVWINLTQNRLHLRVDRRIAQSSLYLRLLNASFETVPNTTQILHLSHTVNQGGMGNFLFQVAGLLGMSVRNRRSPSLIETYWCEKYFHNFKLEKINQTEFVGNNGSRDPWIIGDNGWGKYSPQMENVTALKGYHNVFVAGYMQSWKYFHFIRDDVRSLFTFSTEVYESAIRSITNAMHSLPDSSKMVTLPWLVGMHVRRGDILDPGQNQHGHQPASMEYLLRAALHFQRTYDNAIFVVISNDIPYCKQLLVEPNFLFMENNNEAVDIAVLSLMDHVIMSVGTYSWWGAYLSDAKEVFYYKNWPRNGSDMANGMNKEDYFLPTWTAFD